MNINIILDPEYICKELSEETSALRVCNLFMMLKHKSNIIIIQDKDKKITTNILHQLAYNFENIENQEIIEEAFFDTHPENDDASFEGVWNSYPFFESGVLAVSDINRGLFLIKKK